MSTNKLGRFVSLIATVTVLSFGLFPVTVDAYSTSRCEIVTKTSTTNPGSADVSLTITNNSNKELTTKSSVVKTQTFKGSGLSVQSSSDISYLFYEPLLPGQARTMSLGSQAIPEPYKRVRLAVKSISPKFTCSTVVKGL